MSKTALICSSHHLRGSLAARWHGAVPRTGISVYFYHGLVERGQDPIPEGFFHNLSDFKRHASFLRRHRILSVAELADELKRKRVPDKPAVVITFDDGYANNLAAAEILSRMRIPWCLFIPTNAVGKGKTIWTAEVSLLLLYGQARELDILGTLWLLRDPEERRMAHKVIMRSLKRLPAEQRRQALDALRNQFPKGETERLLSCFPAMQTLSWEQIGELARSGVEIGSHGIDHEIHHAAESNAVRRQELELSKAELEQRLNQPCRYFAFPNGNCCPESEGEVRQAGYELAFTTFQDTVTTASNPAMLPRLIPSLSLYSFIRSVSWDFRTNRRLSPRRETVPAT